MTKLNIHKLNQLLFIGVFFPFIDVVRVLKFETSPLAGVIAFSLCSFLFITRKNNIIRKEGFYCLLFIILLISRFRVDYILDSAYIVFYVKTIISFILGMSVFICSSKFGFHFTKKLLSIYVFVWLFVGVLQLSPLATTIQPFLELLMTRSSFSDQSGRGINMLANEPSYAGIYIVLFLVLFDYFGVIGEKVKARYYAILFVASFLTFSSNAVLLLFSYVGVKVFFSRIRIYIKALFVIIPIALIALLLSIDVEARSLNMLKLLLESPSLLLEDQSLSSRFYYILTSYYGIFNSYLMGWGTGSYSFNWMSIVDELNIINTVPQAIEIQRSYIESRYISPMSFLGGIGHDLGLLGVVIALFIIFTPVYLCRKYRAPRIVSEYIILSCLIVFMLWLQTASYSLPLPWFILGLNYNLIYFVKSTKYE